MVTFRESRREPKKYTHSLTGTVQDTWDGEGSSREIAVQISGGDTMDFPEHGTEVTITWEREPTREERVREVLHDSLFNEGARFLGLQVNVHTPEYRKGVEHPLGDERDRVADDPTVGGGRCRVSASTPETLSEQIFEVDGGACPDCGGRVHLAVGPFEEGGKIVVGPVAVCGSCGFSGQDVQFFSCEDHHPTHERLRQAGRPAQTLRWIAEKQRTHTQVQCGGCGGWLIWLPKEDHAPAARR